MRLRIRPERLRISSGAIGSGIVPNSRAVLIDDLLRARLGLTAATIEAASTPPSVPLQPAEIVPKE
jgi:hypothetical protein